jgi:hypothetical protein
MSGDVADDRMVASRIPPLKSSYDLTWRGRRALRRRYRCVDQGSVLDDAGRAVRRELRTAEVSTDILELSSDGAPMLRWTYTDFTWAVELQSFDDLDPPPAARLYEASTRDEALPSNPIVIEGNLEACGSDCIDLAAMGLATSLAAAMTGELIVHTRTFWQIATRRHGGIDRLCALGDNTRMPWSGTTDQVRAGEVFSAAVHRGESSLRFDCLTIRHGREAALLTYRTPYDPSIPGWGPAHCEPQGQIWIELASGEILAGRCISLNNATRIPQADGAAVSLHHRLETSLELLG